MVSMGIGFERRGKIPFISTFGCFFTRAHDQIRMAAIGTAALTFSVVRMQVFRLAKMVHRKWRLKILR